MLGFILAPLLAFIAASFVFIMILDVAAITFFLGAAIACLVLAALFGMAGREWDNNVAFSIWFWFLTFVSGACWVICCIIKAYVS
jgi:predicted permease